MAQFLWLDWNLAKIDMHHLATEEVEFAWECRTDVAEWDEPVPGVESYGRAPNGRWIKIIWRYNGIGDGDLVFVVTAYHTPHPPPGRGCPKHETPTPMANLRVLVKRRKAVRNIRKITKTMELIATSRFQRALKRAQEAEAYTRKIAELAADLSKNAGDVSHPLLVTRPVKKSVLLVITANRGLCGGYNGSILREAMGATRKYAADRVPFDLEAAGRRGIAFFRFQGIARTKEYTNFEDKPTFAEVDAIASHYIDLFTAGQIDEVKVAYMKFVSSARQQAVVETLLPLSSVTVETQKPAPAATAAPEAAGAPKVDYEFLPDASEILEELVPAALKVRLFKCFLDAAVSEQIARRVAMKAATENAGDLIKEITRIYNRTRQANITKEISELIAGSEALK